MPGMTLVTGGPASGKTQRLLDLAAQGYEEDPFADVLVLVPTARHADQFRQRLVMRRPAAFGLDVTTLGLFAARYTSDAGIVPSEIAREMLARITIERAASSASPAGRFRPIVHTRGLHRLVSTAVTGLVADSIDPQAFGQACQRTGSPDLRALADIYGAYLEELSRRGWHAPGEQARLAARFLSAAALPPLVLVDGVQFLRAGEIELLAALATRSEVYVALDPSASARSAWAVAMLEAAAGPGLQRESFDASHLNTPPASAFTTVDDEAQLREIARSIKQRLVDDASLRPSDFAVVFRRVGPHLATARRVFREYRLPLDPAAGEPLSERPFGVWALRLLRLGAHGWKLLDVLDACTAGFFDGRGFDLEPGHLYRLRELGRRNMLWSGLPALAQLSEAARTEAADRGGAAGEGLLAAAKAWADVLDDLASCLDPEVVRTPGEHARLVGSMLFGINGLARTDIAAADAPFVEAGALQAELAAIRGVEEALGSEPVSFAAFVDTLEARMQRPSTLIREAGGVLLAPMHTLHGLRFQRVYLAGLSEGEFPARSRTGMLLGLDARAALKIVGFELPPEQHATEDELWQTSITRAGNVSRWRGRVDASGRPAAASYYFTSPEGDPVAIAAEAPPERTASTRELAISLTRRWPEETRRPVSMAAWDIVVREAAAVEQRRRSFASAGRYEGETAGIAVTRLVDPAVEWSARRLESYRTCPFQFFARYGLRLRELDEEQPEADAATRGIVVHEMLEDALAPLAAADRPLDSSSLAQTIERLRTRGREIWDAAPAKHAFGRAALWRYEAERYISRLESLLKREAEYAERLGMTAVLGGERDFAAALPGIDPPLLVSGKVDRVDTGGDAVQVVDYKTGRYINKKAVQEGRKLQLQLYALVAQVDLEAPRVIARYSFLRPGKEWQLDSQDSAESAFLADAARIAAEVRADVTAGAFAVAPAEVDCPTYCAARTACRVNSFSRSKTWS